MIVEVQLVIAIDNNIATDNNTILRYTIYMHVICIIYMIILSCLQFTLTRTHLINAENKACFNPLPVSMA